jgi:hypothetical protein
LMIIKKKTQFQGQGIGLAFTQNNKAIKKVGSSKIRFILHYEIN